MRFLIYICVIILSSGCSLRFSEEAYSQAISAKVNGLKLMESSTEPFDLHQKKVENYKHELLLAYEYAKGRGKRNRYAIEQWRVINAEDGGSITEWLVRWENRGSFELKTIELFQPIFSDHFDQLIELEHHKTILDF